MNMIIFMATNIMLTEKHYPLCWKQCPHNSRKPTMTIIAHTTRQLFILILTADICACMHMQLNYLDIDLQLW